VTEFSNHVEPAVLGYGKDCHFRKRDLEVAVHEHCPHHHHKGFASTGDTDGDSACRWRQDGFPLLICRLVILSQLRQRILFELFDHCRSNAQAAIVEK